MACHNSARSLSSGSLLTVGSQEMMRLTVFTSRAVNKSSPTWKSLMEWPKLLSCTMYNPPSDDQMHQMVDVMHHLPPSCWTLPSALPSALPWPVIYTRLPVRNSPHKRESTSCSLVPCTMKPGTSSGTRSYTAGESVGFPGTA